MEMDTVEYLIDNTIIAKLKEKNIFAKFLSVDDIRNKLLKQIKCIEYEDLSKMGGQAAWLPESSKIVLDVKLKPQLLYSEEAQSTLIHELLHVLSTNGDYCGLAIDWKRGRGLNEGVTEYLAQQLCPTSQRTMSFFGVSFKIQGTYELQQIMIRQLAILYGEEKILDAYLNNKDIDMPQDAYTELIENFDQIDKWESHLRSRSNEPRCFAEMRYQLDVVGKIQSLFIQSQQFFLETCLRNKIAFMNTIEEANDIILQLRELNLLEIKIGNSKKANYERYNFMFIRKYLQIVNKDKEEGERITFDEIEAFLTNKIIDLDNRLTTNANQQKLDINDNNLIHDEFIEIDREQGGKIYIREVRRMIIAGNNISEYEYLTENEFNEQIFSHECEIDKKIIGNIDLERLNNDEEYKNAVSYKLLAQDRLEERLLNYNGYIGNLDDNLEEQIIDEIQERFEELEKYIKVNPDGYDQEMYIREVTGVGECRLSGYILLDREGVEILKKTGVYDKNLLLQCNIELEKIKKDEKYKLFLEKFLLAKACMEKYGRSRGCILEIKSKEGEYYLSFISEEDDKLVGDEKYQNKGESR